MNREQKRKLTRNLTHNGKTKAEAENIVDTFARAQAIRLVTGGETNAPNEIEEGDRVMLNVDLIKARPNYKSMNEKYKEFVDRNAETVFTAQPEMKNVFSMKEDPDRWYFWSGDLIRTAEIWQLSVAEES